MRGSSPGRGTSLHWSTFAWSTRSSRGAAPPESRPPRTRSWGRSACASRSRARREPRRGRQRPARVGEWRAEAGRQPALRRSGSGGLPSAPGLAVRRYWPGRHVRSGQLRPAACRGRRLRPGPGAGHGGLRAPNPASASFGSLRRALRRSRLWPRWRLLHARCEPLRIRAGRLDDALRAALPRFVRVVPTDAGDDGRRATHRRHDPFVRRSRAHRDLDGSPGADPIGPGTSGWRVQPAGARRDPVARGLRPGGATGSRIRPSVRRRV